MSSEEQQPAVEVLIGCKQCRMRYAKRCELCSLHTEMCYGCNLDHHKCESFEPKNVHNNYNIEHSLKALVEREQAREEQLKNKHACELEIIREQYEAQITDMNSKFERAQQIYQERAERMKHTYETALKEMEDSIKELQDQKNELRNEKEMNTAKRGEMEMKLKEMSESFKQIDIELKEAKKSLPKPLQTAQRGRGTLIKRGASSTIMARPDNLI